MVAAWTREFRPIWIHATLPNQVRFLGVLVTEIPAPRDGSFDFIIGMDIIGIGDLAITNVGGHTCLSFRTPSLETIDYVAEIHRASGFTGMGRNAQSSVRKRKKMQDVPRR